MGGRLFFALIGWVLGAAVQMQQARLWADTTYLGIGCVGAGATLVLAVRAGRLPGVCWLWLAVAATLSMAQVGWRATVRHAGVLQPELEGRDLLVTGRIDDLPRRTPDGSWRFVLAVEHATQVQPRAAAGSASAGDSSVAGPAVEVPPRLMLAWYAPRPEKRSGARSAGRPAEITMGATGERQAGESAEPDNLPTAQRSRPPSTRDMRAGQRWRLAVRLQAPHGYVNPHGRDEELWSWERGILAQGSVRDGPLDLQPVQLGQPEGRWVDRWRQQVRDRIEQRAALGGDEALRRSSGILAALVLGDQGAIAAEDWDVFRDTGISHLIAVSGLHITLFAWLAVQGLRRLWRRSAWLSRRMSAPVAAALGGLLLATLYALFCGWGVPAQRTIWMLGLVTLLRLSGGRWPRPMIWTAAMAVIVAADPWALLQAGFWLSFVAVGVLFTEARQVVAPMGAPAVRRFARLGRLAAPLVAVSREQWRMTLSLAPLSLLLFQQTSLVGLLVNLAAIPYVSFLVLPLALLGVAVPWLWSLDAVLIDAMMRALAFFAAWPWATWSIPARPLWIAVLGVIAGAAAVLPWPWRWRLLFLPWALPLLLWQWPAPKEGEFEVVALDVGQGQAIVVRTAHHVLLVDSGPPIGKQGDAGQRIVLPYLQARGLALDRLLLSHTDIDHAGGAAAVLQAHAKADWLGSAATGFALHRQRAGVPCRRGQSWQWDGVNFRVLYPEEPDDARAEHEANAMSCVLQVGNGRAEVLLPGDIGVAQERELLVLQGADWRVDGLTMPHHGSRHSSSPAFLAQLQPRWAVAQAGYRNRHGHPAPDAVARYRAQGVEIVDTARCGAWLWRSDRPATGRCERETVLRYWHHVGMP